MTTVLSQHDSPEVVVDSPTCEGSDASLPLTPSRCSLPKRGRGFGAAAPGLLVLDLDGTLIAETESGATDATAVLARPHLREFLLAANALGYDLAIWSASCRAWIDTVLQVIWPTDAVGEPVFVFTGARCVLKRHMDGMHESADATVIKPLKKVWKSFPQYTKQQTIVLDNTPSTYTQNYGNALAVRTFTCYATNTTADSATTAQPDKELLTTLKYIRYLSCVENVRAANRDEMRRVCTEARTASL
jgi:hypothetical protein